MHLDLLIGYPNKSEENTGLVIFKKKIVNSDLTS